MFKKGIYRHFKTGREYRVLGIAKHTETLEDFVMYEALYENTTSNFWIRPLKMFTEEVSFEGKTAPRFLFVRSE